MKSNEHLIVDAYNVMHSSSYYRDLISHDIESARQRFIDDVRIIHDCEGIFLTIVFDGRGDKNEIIELDKSGSLVCIYTASSVSADGIIERLVSKSKKPERMTVVSRDNLIAETVRALRAVVIGVDELLNWMDRCHRMSMDRVKKRSPKELKIRDIWKQG